MTAGRVLPPPESWHYHSLPGYEILSDASAPATRRFISEFQQFQAAVRTVWPALFDIRPGVPTLVVIVLAEGARRFPKSISLLYKTAVLCLRGDDSARAAAFIRVGMRVADDAHDRGLFQSLEARLTAEASGTSP